MFKQTEQLVISENGVVLESDENMRKKRKLPKSSRKGEESAKIKKLKKVPKDDKDCLSERKCMLNLITRMQNVKTSWKTCRNYVKTVQS